MRPAVATAVIGIVLLTLISNPWSAGAGDVERPWAAPELPHQDPLNWVNSDPLTLADLEGKVVLVDFWTFGCWNCYRSFPFLKNLEDRYGEDEFVIIGVHTPEFEHEKERDSVVEKVAEFGLEHPVMLDNDFAYWNAMNNRYWPTFYLIDKAGQVRGVYVGETRAGDRRATAIETKVKKLLAETT